MDATHLHLLFNHVGILGILFSTLLLIAAMLVKSEILKRAAMVGLIIATVATGITMNTGEGAEESVENLQGISEATIHEHEESAETTIWLVGVCGLLSLVGIAFYFMSKSLPSIFYTVLLLLTLVASYMIFNTGRLGGLIRHSELSGTTGAVQQNGTELEEHIDD